MAEAQFVERPVSATATKESTDGDNPPLPPELQDFEQESIKQRYMHLTEAQWLGALHATEIDDKKQTLWLRPVFVVGAFLLVMGQSVGIWFVVVWALQTRQLHELQLIFSTLIAGTLTQSYFILRFITNKVFSDIDYHNGSDDKKN